MGYIRSSNCTRTFFAFRCRYFDLNENNLKITGIEALGELCVWSGYERMFGNEG